jgi:hypothetical protein
MAVTATATLLRPTQSLPVHTLSSPAPGSGLPPAVLPSWVTGWSNTGGGWWRAPDPNNPQNQISYNANTNTWDYSNPYAGVGVQANNLGAGAAPTSLQQAALLFNSVFGGVPQLTLQGGIDPPAPSAPGSAGSPTTGTPAAVDPYYAGLLQAFQGLTAGAPGTGSSVGSLDPTATPPAVTYTPAPASGSGGGGNPLVFVLLLVALAAGWYWWQKHHKATAA